MDAHGVPLHAWEAGGKSGRGEAVLCIHETAATSEVWRPLASELGEAVRTIAYDRRGWGRSGAPEPYTRTTVEEQAEDAAVVLDQLEAAPAVLCGAGIGAVIALELLLRRPSFVRGAILIEPPLLAFSPAATEALSKDAVALQEALAEGGPEAGLELYISGALGGAGPGAERLPDSVSRSAREHPLTLFAELSAVPSWPIARAAMRGAERPSRIVTASSTPPVVRDACDELARLLRGSARREVSNEGLPHHGGATALSGIVRELAGSPPEP